MPNNLPPEGPPSPERSILDPLTRVGRFQVEALIGTGAWFFMLVNTIKVPFSVQLGLITPQSLLLDAVLILPMIPGALLGPVMLRHINQTKFEAMVLILAALAALRLFF